jgi:hypothetical protein
MQTATQANGWWDPCGDADWRLIGCQVTAAWRLDGSPADDEDGILRCLVADPDRRRTEGSGAPERQAAPGGRRAQKETPA